MKTHLLLLVVGLALAFTLMRTVHTPELMITPGTTIQAHKEVANDCFACHTPFIGATAEKCIDCHKVDEIGLLTTKGVSIASEKKNVRFHQQLLESDCVACHSDHKGVQPFRPISHFSHNLLKPELQKQCNSCHNKPKDSLHRKLKAECSQCHSRNEWKPATFRHKSLDPVELRQCESCHDKPKDEKHRKFKSNCNVCHGYDDWEATHFKHSKLPPVELKQCESCHDKPRDDKHRKFRGNCDSCHGYNDWDDVDFKHSKLPPAELKQCESCHDKPRDDRHRKFRGNCDSCHGYDDWDDVDFKHSKLPPAELKQCQSCHEKPDDSLHGSTKLECGECHGQEKWKPATFKHDKYFRFDRHHRTDCDTCHINNDYAGYTCYGCHEHSRSNIRSEHLEEGIRDYEDCTECHRSGNEHEAKRIWRSKRYGGEVKGGYSGEHDWDEYEHDDDD